VNAILFTNLITGNSGPKELDVNLDELSSRQLRGWVGADVDCYVPGTGRIRGRVKETGGVYYLVPTDGIENFPIAESGDGRRYNTVIRRKYGLV